MTYELCIYDLDGKLIQTTEHATRDEAEFAALDARRFRGSAIEATIYRHGRALAAWFRRVVR